MVKERRRYGFSEDMYNVRMFDGLDVAIGGPTRLWQNLVLSGLLQIHRDDETALASLSLLLDHNDNPIKSMYGASGHEPVVVGHAIDIPSVWEYVYDHLTMFGYTFDGGYEDDESIEGNKKIGMRLGGYVAIESYLDWLYSEGYVIDLHTRMGHADENSYILSTKMACYIDVEDQVFTV